VICSIVAILSPRLLLVASYGARNFRSAPRPTNCDYFGGMLAGTLLDIALMVRR
jgi:hypothetical protein